MPWCFYLSCDYHNNKKSSFIMYATLYLLLFRTWYTDVWHSYQSPFIIFVQVGHQTTYAPIGNHHPFTLSCDHQAYQNYQQSRQKLGTFLENKVFWNQSFQKMSLIIVGLLVFNEMFHWFLTQNNDFEIRILGSCKRLLMILQGLTTMTWYNSEKWWYPIVAHVLWWPTCTKNLERYLTHLPK